MIETEKRITIVEESTKSAHKRIDKLESVQEQLHKLAESISEVAFSTRDLCDKMKDANIRIRAIESKSGQKWDSLVLGIMAALTGGIVGYFISQILGG